MFGSTLRIRRDHSPLRSRLLVCWRGEIPPDDKITSLLFYPFPFFFSVKVSDGLADILKEEARCNALFFYFARMLWVHEPVTPG